ncbi:DUF3024 domain-containing protein [Luteolibacter sp. Populi]|uniref:DUF3024 domain-containing protein n=1 Tax=Luteolibacter sp. Populi TaxID=3230487 RepID=UPI0034662118
MDFGYRITGQSVELTERRPDWRNPEETIEIAAAKATYVRTVSRWRIFWNRADCKWHTYKPYPEALLFDEFLAVVDEDEHCCFWG